MYMYINYIETKPTKIECISCQHLKVCKWVDDMKKYKENVLKSKDKETSSPIKVSITCGEYVKNEYMLSKNLLL